MKRTCGIFLCGLFLPLLPVTLFAQQMDIRDFVHQTYFEGMPYDAANTYTSVVVPTLLEMLQDDNEAPYWANIAVTLCIIGEESAVEPIISFIEEDVEGELSDSHYRAKSSAVMALGYLINRSGNERALNYLVESIDPDAWNQRDIQWQASSQASSEARDVDLSTMAILGLALSGRPEAAEALNVTPQAKFMGVQPGVGGLVQSALETHQTVAAEGLSEYYRRAKSGFE